MQLIKEKNKIYILLTNAEEIVEYQNPYLGNEMFMIFRAGEPVYFQGPQGAWLLVIEEVIEAERVLPHDTTSRSYWGEFKRRHRLEPRLTKLTNKERNQIIKCRFVGDISESELHDNSFWFNSFVTAGFDRDTLHGVQNKRTYKKKTWNLTNDRHLGPNLKDYSINDNFKYYTLL